MGKRIAALALGLLLGAGARAAPAQAGVREAAAGRSVSAQAYILAEASTGRVLAAGNERLRLPVASTTKIMTALIALERSDIQTEFKVDSAALRVEGTSMGLQEGDTVSLYALAHGMLLSSGNDAANAAAVRISGSVPKFAEKMNEYAVRFGMEDTHFVTPSGLHDGEHYSTAADMATLARHALQNAEFAEICRKTSAKVRFGSPPFDRWLTNHNKLLKYYPGCVGMKTGFTKKAGRCLVSAAERDGVTLVCVTLNASNDWDDHARLYDWGFSQTALVPVWPKTAGLRAPVVGGLADSVPVEALTPVMACVAAEQEAELTQKLILKPFYYAPLQRGDIVGRAELYYRGFRVGSCELIAGGDAAYDTTPPKKSLWQKLAGFFRFGKAAEASDD